MSLRAPTTNRGRASIQAGLIASYLLIMPFVIGLPRGTVVPLLRPSEMLQLAVTAMAAAMAMWAVATGRRWELRIRSIEWWLLAMAAAASVIPLLWLAARQRPVGLDELLAAFPFVKYAALYLLARSCVRTAEDVILVLRATAVGALVVAAIAIAQALGFGPVVDVLGRFFVSSVEDVVDGGRGTTTIGSSIATGAYLTMVCGIALSYGLATGRRLWLAAGAALALGALASGQAGTVLALAVIIVVVARLHHRSTQLIQWGIPTAAIGVAGLWPIAAARLADLDQGTGLPESWVVRWNNISELYLPSLLDWGWVLGVTPDAILAPPDVFRTAVYLESGYLWLLWVGGLPLLAAAGGFLYTAWHALAPRSDSAGTAIGATRIAARAAIAMVATLSLIDPHLTLRAGADVLFVLIPLGLAAVPLTAPMTRPSARWRHLLTADGAGFRPHARLQLSEAGAGSATGPSEMELAVTVREGGTTIASTRLTLQRGRIGLRGVVGPVDGVDWQACGLAWRAVVLVARSLRLRELQATESARRGQRFLVDRAELARAARLAERLENDRAAHGASHPPLPPQQRAGGADVTDVDSLPAIRVDLGRRTPHWKRTVDLVGGTLALAAASPLLVISAVLVRRSSPGPALFRQVRVGTGGLPFQIYKFRTMYVGNDDSAQRAQNRRELRGDAEAAKDEDDPRITPVGRWLRRTSLDELPQLINVLRSEMSLVGPRPALLWESELFQPAARRRLVTRPGLTGLWQTSGRADVSMKEMLELDLDYVDRMGPLLDLRCLAKTATAVVAGEGAR